MKKNKLGVRIWSTLLLFGLFGQIAWVIENMYFNKFLYDTISGDARHIAWMVAASAATATLTTIVMGALSDRVGRRKAFISFGYVLWGLSTMAFAFISTDAAAELFPNGDATLIAAAVVIAMDCVMTFFGSTANDGAFNAWVTDVTTPDVRGKVDGILAILPLTALLLIFGGFDGFAASGDWSTFFLVLGGLVSAGGVAGFFLIREDRAKPSEGHYWRTVAHGFLPSTVKANPTLYLILLTLAVFTTAGQVYMPYFIIYIVEYLDVEAYAILLGAVILAASIAGILVTRKVSAATINRYFLPSLSVMAVGLVLLWIARDPLFVGIAGFVMMSGNLVFTGVLNAKMRDRTPLGKAGRFQGIRMIFFVLIPMIVGPFIGSSVIRGNGETFVEFGVVKDLPTPAIFLAAAIVCVLTLVPLWFMLRRDKVEPPLASDSQ
ncbi:MAG: MFS transporter [Candidatus Izemoplasmatales bacterium]